MVVELRSRQLQNNPVEAEASELDQATEETINSRLDLILNRTQALEVSVAEQNKKIDKNIADMFEIVKSMKSNQASSSGKIGVDKNYTAVSATPGSFDDSSGQHRGYKSGPQASYAGITRIGKVDFPRFDGNQARDWLFQVEEFFEVDHTPQDMKVKMAAIHFNGKAATWHRSLLHTPGTKRVLRDWEAYKLELLDRFENVLDDPISELKQLQETNGIEEYHKKFELLRTRVKLPEAYLVRAYLDGLQPDTQVNVQMLQPQTVSQCFLVGRLYEQAHPPKRCSELKAKEDKEVAEIEVKNGVEKKSIDKMTHEVILKEELIPQFQVPVSNLEPSFQICNASPTVCEEFSYTYAMVGIDQVQFNSGFECVNGKDSAYHVFDKMLLSKYRLQQRRKLSLSPKSWKFKYKEVKVLRRLPKNDQDNLRGGMIIKQLHEMSKVGSGFNQKTRIELEMYGWNYKKPINPDQIRLKSMCEVAELQGIELRAFNKRIRELLFGYCDFKVQLLPDFRKRCVVIVGKKAPNVDITATNKQLEYTREGRGEKEEEFEHVVNHTPFSVEKLGRLRDRDAVLIKQFLLSDEKFHIKHKWRSKFLYSISELVLCFDSVELSISYANSGDYLLKRGSFTVHYEYSMWKQNDQLTKLFGSRRLVIHTVGRGKTVEEMYQRVDQLVNMKLANIGKMLAVTQSQTFDPGIRLEAKETLRSYVPSRAAAMVLMVKTHESMEETTWEFSLFCSDNFQTLNLVVKVLQTGEL
ncbi:Retrotransposon gag domain [Arabidopsis thaliana x Arabidopsis arenosa]|uniref:Retrotransposon gag domain n=1 Tax=Arabidopsis thaliana x Arabidopsis arenosa TaxID=1240361 RepID=A0A8T2AN22_9BRAS|nr:Retrotransposon gag domain [Arabidopsis thaliana x Arabidopsis arenosa]